MSLEASLAFCANETVLCLIPGPAVLVVVSVGLARGACPGLCGVARRPPGEREGWTAKAPRTRLVAAESAVHQEVAAFFGGQDLPTTWRLKSRTRRIAATSSALAV
jgi:hypothetical protein